MKQLQLPPTIRTARPDEIPARSELIDRIMSRHTANIVEGFTLRENQSTDLPFKFYAEINVDNQNLWALFTTLFLQLPEKICLIYGHIDDAPAYSPYLDKYKIFNVLEPYKVELCNGGFLEFGVLHQQETYLEEIFIKKSKYIQYWGMDEARFRSTMTQYDIYEVEGLNFIDEYPLVTEALRLHYPEAIETGDILMQLEESLRFPETPED